MVVLLPSITSFRPQSRGVHVLPVRPRCSSATNARLWAGNAGESEMRTVTRRWFATVSSCLFVVGPHGRRPLMALSRRITVLVVAVLTLLVAVPLTAQPVKLVAESYHVPARDPDIQLHVRNKRPADMTQFSAERTLLYVHGTSQAASSTFDLA